MSDCQASGRVAHAASNTENVDADTSWTSTYLYVSMELCTAPDWRRIMNLPHQRPDHTPEQLVGLGFRGWFAGYEYQDIAYWDEVWSIYIAALGPKQAKYIVTDLSSWIRTIKQTACRPIQTLPSGCCGFCEDERTAIAIIAASQHDHCPALKVCARTLLGSPHVDAMLNQASGFALMLAAAGQHLELLSANSTLRTGQNRFSTFNRQ